MKSKRDPRSHPPTYPDRTEKVKMDNVMPRLQGRLAAGHENPVRVSVGGEEEWPVDLPVRIDVHRVYGTFQHDIAGPATGLMGHIVDADFYPQKCRVVIKVYRAPLGIAVIVNEEELFRSIVEDHPTIIEDEPKTKGEGDDCGNYNSTGQCDLYWGHIGDGLPCMDSTKPDWKLEESEDDDGIEWE